jgi:hypothetical protein
MKQSKFLGIFIALLLLLLFVQPVIAQTYYFQVSSMEVNLFINSDGTATLEYLWVFDNSSSADSIQYVDVGLPNSDYDFNSISATINQQPIPSYNISQIDKGITLDLGSNAIQPGNSGTVYLKVGTISNLLYHSNKKDYAHFSFEPSWFGKNYVYGSTNVVVTLYLPAGMTTDEPIYDTPKSWPGTDAPQSWIDNQGRVVYQWSTSSGSGDAQYTFGASFPSRLVPAETLKNAPFLSLTQSDWNHIVITICSVLCGGFIAFIVYLSAVAAKKRKLQYLPPKIAMEGNGIKRGLTPVEAGILMEQPMDRLLTMMLFSTVKKGAATVVSKEPLKLTITDPVPQGLLPYEIEFLRAFQKQQPQEQKMGLQEMMINLVKSVSEKMKGFSRKETLTYYEGIMKQAWQQVQQANTPEVKSQVFDQVMDWTMLDPQYGQRTQETFGPIPIFVPLWWGRYDPAYRTAPAIGGAQSSAPKLSTGHSSSPINMPRLAGADFAASVTKSTQTFSNSVLGGLAAFTGSVTNKTNPVPVPTVSSSGSRPGGFGGSSGGHSCACACACAGCACACAGGGR